MGLASQSAFRRERKILRLTLLQNALTDTVRDSVGHGLAQNGAHPGVAQQLRTLPDQVIGGQSDLLTQHGGSSVGDSLDRDFLRLDMKFYLGLRTIIRSSALFIVV